MPRCRVIDCSVKNALFNNYGETRGICCLKHKEPEMIDVKNKTCKYDGCNIRPNFNFLNETIGIYCKIHKLEKMVDVKNKRCQSDGCKIQPAFNFEGEKLAIYCKIHKLEKMVDIKHKRCKNSWCNTQTKQKYKGYCLRCFIYEFPNEKISRNYKIKETHVVDYLKETFPDRFTFNKTVGGCSKRRPDAYLDLLTHIIIVECDENQHTNYDTTCEIARINELFTDLGDRPIVFIRFNPDEYDNKQSSFKYHKTTGVPMIHDTTEWNERLESLKNCINKYIHNIPSETIVEYLFYDKNYYF